jgi:D-alanine transaminase
VSAAPPASPPDAATAGSNELCLLDGTIQPLASARIHPLDRGFLYGDAVYEVIAVRAGTPLFLAAHLERLAASLAAVAIPQPPTLEQDLRRLLAQSGLADGGIYLEITRGVAPRQPMPPPDLVPTVFAMPLPHRPRTLRPAGLSAVTMPDPRWTRCDIKTTSLMATVLGKLAARDAGADEVVFLGPAEELREGGNVSLFVVLEDPRAAGGATATAASPPGRLCAPGLGPHLLPGVTRGVVLAALGREGVPVEFTAPALRHDPTARSQRRLPPEVRELIALGTLTGVQAITRLDGTPVGNGAPGPWAAHLSALLDAAERAEVALAAGGEIRAGAHRR